MRGILEILLFVSGNDKKNTKKKLRLSREYKKSHFSVAKCGFFHILLNGIELCRDGGMVDTMDSKSIASRCESSSLSRGTICFGESKIQENKLRIQKEVLVSTNQI